MSNFPGSAQYGTHGQTLSGLARATGVSGQHPFPRIHGKYRPQWKLARIVGEYGSRGGCHLTALALVLLLHCCGVAAEIDSFTEPYRDIEVAASDFGLLKSVDVKEGDRVSSGQLLASMDDSMLQASLEIAKITKEARGRYESAKAEVDLHSATVSKLTELHQRQHASRQELDRAELQLTVAKATLRAILEEQSIRELEYERTRVQLAQRRLRAPIDGIVVTIRRDPGEFVSLTDPVIMRVVQIDPLLVMFSTPAAHGRKLKAGQVVQMRVDDSEPLVSGTVEFVSPTADPQSGTIKIRVRIPNPGEKLPCGATCRLILPGQVPATNERVANDRAAQK